MYPSMSLSRVSLHLLHHKNEDELLHLSFLRLSSQSVQLSSSAIFLSEVVIMSRDAIRDRFGTPSIAEAVAYLTSSSFHHEKFLSVIAAIFPMYSPFYWSSTHFVQTSGLFLDSFLYLTHFAQTSGTCLLVVEIQPYTFVIALHLLLEIIPSIAVVNLTKNPILLFYEISEWPSQLKKQALSTMQSKSKKNG